jgi:hypothetical protein
MVDRSHPLVGRLAYHANASADFDGDLSAARGHLISLPLAPAAATSDPLPGRRLRPWITAGIRRCVRRAS